jgi:antirestriction protein ArdC
MKQDVYERITNRIVADLEQGVRPWLKPWNPEHAAGRITRPLRHNGVPYQGINVLMLWGDRDTASTFSARRRPWQPLSERHGQAPDRGH